MESEKDKSLTNLLLTPWFQSFKLFHNPKEPMHDENKTLPLNMAQTRNVLLFFMINKVKFIKSNFMTISYNKTI